MRVIVATAVLIFINSFTAPVHAQPYPAGFKIISTYDSSRTYKPNSPLSDKLHFRPLDIDLWYPAGIVPSDTTASFSDLVYLFEKRSNFYDDTKRYDGLTDELLQYICAGLNCKDHNILKKLKTNSYVNAKPIAQPFPLIIYLAGFNGMSYENYLLFESLAKHGFVVASVSSIGAYPGNMTMDSLGVYEQINDANFVIDHLTKKYAFSNNMGLIGYSWGGLASAIMAMTEPGKIKAVVSLDGSEQFAYGDPEEDEKLNRIRKARFFKPEAIRASFLYLDSDIAEGDDSPDSIYNIADHILGDKYYLKIKHSKHEDFSSLSVLAPEDRIHSAYDVIQALTVNYMLDKLKGRNIFYEKIPTEDVTKNFSQPLFARGAKAAGKMLLKGIIRDQTTNLPLPYVNIGILNKDKGTASNLKGEFQLPLLEANLHDTLRISMIGYESRDLYLKDVLQTQKHLNLHLRQKTVALDEVGIVDKKLATKVLGNKTESKFFGGKFASGDLGSELAIRIKIKNIPTYLENFSFNISYNTADTATFRVNIYDIRNGLPYKNILTRDIIARINNRTGRIDINLSDYNITVNDDFFIGLQWLEGRHSSGVTFSAGFVNKGTYYRKASQARWKKYPMGVGFNVTTKY
ncbi:MAG TPA: alpha/beta fold hydrolase [Chryseolinea sp.]